MFCDWLQNDGMPPAEAADIIFAGIQADALYIYTHPETMVAVRARMDDILQQRNPLL